MKRKKEYYTLVHFYYLIYLSEMERKQILLNNLSEEKNISPSYYFRIKLKQNIAIEYY